MAEQQKNAPIQALNEKEKARAGKTARQLQKSIDNEYKIKEITIGPLFANIMGLIWGIVFSLPMFIAYYLHNGYLLGGPSSGVLGEILFILVNIVLIVAHEVIHGICMYMFNGHDKDNIEFGMNSGMPYCTCQSVIKKWQYFIVLVMPTLILSTIMSMVAVLSGQFLWLLIGFVIICGGGGDFTICAKLLTQKEKDMRIVDHPYKCGFLALSKSYEQDESMWIINALTAISENTADVDQEKKHINKKAVIICTIAIMLSAFIGGIIFGYLTEVEDNNQTTNITETMQSSGD